MPALILIVPLLAVWFDQTHKDRNYINFRHAPTEQTVNVVAEELPALPEPEPVSILNIEIDPKAVLLETK